MVVTLKSGRYNLKVPSNEDQNVRGEDNVVLGHFDYPWVDILWCWSNLISKGNKICEVKGGQYNSTSPHPPPPTHTHTNI